MRGSTLIVLTFVCTLVPCTDAALSDGGFFKYQGLAGKQALVDAGDDFGQLTNCGDAKHNFTFKWTPAKIHLGKTITFYTSFTPANTFNDVITYITVWLKDYPDQPIYSGKDKNSCEKVAKKIPDLKITCPIKQGTPFKIEGFKYTIPSQLPLPTADFKVKLDAKDENGKDIICATGVISLVNDQQMKNYPDY